MATKASEPAEAQEAVEESTDSPLLDSTDASVKKMIARAKERGIITYDELNKVLPSEQMSSEQIEDVMTMLSEMGISVVETDEGEETAAPGSGEFRERGIRGSRVPALREIGRERPDRRPGAHVSARNGQRRASVPRGRDRDRQAHRGRPQHDDHRPLREPDDLWRHHHVARRAERRHHPSARRHRPRRHLWRRPGRRRPERGARPVALRRGPRGPSAGGAGQGQRLGRQGGQGREAQGPYPPRRGRGRGSRRRGGRRERQRGGRGGSRRGERLARDDGGRPQAASPRDLRQDRRDLQEGREAPVHPPRILARQRGDVGSARRSATRS